jgi:hypothetical protein
MQATLPLGTRWLPDLDDARPVDTEILDQVFAEV